MLAGQSSPRGHHGYDQTIAAQYPVDITFDAHSSTLSLEPAMDGPPSPERIRAYTEQMRRGSSLSRSARSLTATSATPSVYSLESIQTSSDGMSTPSRKSSLRSISSGQPSQKSERPDSVNLFGKTIFSRTSRRPKNRGNSDGGRSLSSSMLLTGLGSGEQSAKEHYYDTAKSRRRGTLAAMAEQRREYISNPFNFKHLTHTRRDEVPDLDRFKGVHLHSEFVAHRASQRPHSELKGIRADDLHFRNFSQDASSQEETKSDRRRLRKSSPPARRPLTVSRSHDNLRQAPPRPPRSPLSPPMLRELPPRVSSRTASVLFETFDPLSTVPQDRPQTSSSTQEPVAFSPPITYEWTEPTESVFFTEPIYSPPLNLSSEQWPLRSAPLESTFGSPNLEDVPEEDETQTSRRSQFKTDVRASHSVPNFHLPKSKSKENLDFARLADELPTPSALEYATSDSGDMAAKAKRMSCFFDDDWEADIDYCYDHEVEANCDYEWNRTSLDVPRLKEVSVEVSQQTTPALSVDNDDGTHFRGSLLVPKSGDLPELSPLSNLSLESDPRTPAFSYEQHRPTHLRIPSATSTFKESQGFSLSPSLLVPREYDTQLDQDAIYDEYHGLEMLAPNELPMYQGNPLSPNNEDALSTTTSKRASGRSSGFSQTNSYESMSLSSRAASLIQEHSTSSTGSLPELLQSLRPQTRDGESESEVAEAITVDEVSHIVPEITSPSSFTKLNTLVENVRAEPRALESFANFSYRNPAHGRKISAPVNSQEPKPLASGRQRSKSSAPLMSPKKRASANKGYSLFPASN